MALKSPAAITFDSQLSSNRMKEIHLVSVPAKFHPIIEAKMNGVGYKIDVTAHPSPSQPDLWELKEPPIQ